MLPKGIFDMLVNLQTSWLDICLGLAHIAVTCNILVLFRGVTGSHSGTGCILSGASAKTEI